VAANLLRDCALNWLREDVLVGIFSGKDAIFGRLPKNGIFSLFSL
jgi:hypothetical protein